MVTNQLEQGKENLRSSEAALQAITEQAKQGKENLRSSEATLQAITEQAKQGKEDLRSSEAALQAITEQAEQVKENLRSSEAALQAITEQAEQVKENLRLSEAALQAITEQALHDPLTKLPNRHLFYDRLSQAIFSSNRSGCYNAVLFLDINNFKLLNDTYRHAAGDLILIETAKRLKSCIRKTDTVARFGGDEFAVILNNLHIDKNESTRQAQNITEKIRTTLLAPHLLTIKNEGKSDTTIEHCCTASIGVVVFIDQQASLTNLTRIIDFADTAMYQAKKYGGNSIRFFDSSESSRCETIEDSQLTIDNVPPETVEIEMWRTPVLGQ